MMFVGCVSHPVRTDIHYFSGRWETRITIEDSLSKKVESVSVDVLASRDRFFRMDATSVFGVHVGSIVMDGNQLQAVLISEKKFYQGDPSEKVMARIFGLPLDPHLLWNIFFQEAPTDRGWQCHWANDGQLENCENIERKTELSWVLTNTNNREDKDKLESRYHEVTGAHLRHSNYMVRIEFKNFEPHVPIQESKRQIIAPRSFRKMDLTQPSP